MTQLRLALAQVDATVGDLPSNAALVREHAARAAAAGADLVAFPECYPQLAIGHIYHNAEPSEGGTLDRVREAARRHKVLIVWPRAEYDAARGLRDTSILVNRDGEVMVEINENVRGKDVFVLQPTCAPTNHNLMEIMVMVDALRRASARNITAPVSAVAAAGREVFAVDQRALLRLDTGAETGDRYWREVTGLAAIRAFPVVSG